MADKKLIIEHGEENIKQSIDLILSTHYGERSVMADWGSKLNTFLFKNLDSNLAGEIISAVKICLLNYEPRIRVTNVDVEYSSAKEGRVILLIDYLIKKTNSRHNHVYPFSDIEGTSLVTLDVG